MSARYANSTVLKNLHDIHIRFNIHGSDKKLKIGKQYWQALIKLQHGK